MTTNSLPTNSSAQLDGLLLIDKAGDCTSHDVVAMVRRALKQKSVGHTGTLDPIATGLMILVLGEATKLSDYLVASDKSYQVKVRAGVTTDSLDRSGKVLSEKPCAIANEQWQSEVHKLVGEFQWPIPVFSAAKVDGKRLYEYGHRGEVVATPLKAMSFWDIKLEESDSSRAQISLTCSKGSFVRSWAAQLGEALGVGAMVDELRRLRIGSFDVLQALTIEQLNERVASGQGFGAAFVPLAQALPAWKALIAGPKEARLVVNGQVPRDLFNRLIFEQKQAHEQGVPVFIKVMTGAGGLLAILAAEPGQGLKIRRVFRGFA
jgi:tRNA pseudouridine55 synthase